MFSRFSLIAVASLVLGSMPAQAHDIYAHLKDKRGRSCCSGFDCRPAPYRIDSFGLEMFVNDRWIAIPRAVLEYRALEGDTGETGGGHWCGEPWEGSFITYCAFLPPKLAAASYAP